MAREVLRLLGLSESQLQCDKSSQKGEERLVLDIEKAKLWFGWEPQAAFREVFPSVVKALVEREKVRLGMA